MLFKVKAWIVSQISVLPTNWSCCYQQNYQEYYPSRADRTSTPRSKSTQVRAVCQSPPSFPYY